MRLPQGREVEAEQDFAQCIKLNPDLQLTLEQFIKAAKQLLAVK